MDKLVSIISVYYNREHIVRDSINSLLNQTYGNIEVIVVDDGSTDNTYAKLKDINNSRLRVIRHENIGFVKSIKKAVELSNGEYIAIHGSGDISHPYRIEKQVKILEEYGDIGIVSTHACKTDLENTYKRYTNNNFEGNKNFIEQLIKRSIIIHGSAMYRRSIYNAVGGYREFFKFGQDRDLWLRMCMVTKPYIIPEVLYTMYVLPNSVSDNFQKRVMQLFFQSMSNQCIKRRLEGKKDYIDEYGYYAPFFREQDIDLSRKLFRTSITEISKSNLENALIALRLSINEKHSLVSIMLMKIIFIIKKSERLQGIFINLIKKLKKNKF